MFSDVVLDFLVVESVRVVNATIILGNTDQLQSFLSEIFAGEVPHVTEALDNEGLASKTRSHLKFLSHQRIVEE